MFKVGDVCKKLAGRDAGKLCVIVEKIDDVKPLETKFTKGFIVKKHLINKALRTIELCLSLAENIIGREFK